MLALIGYILINFNVTPHSKLKNTHCLLNHFFNHYLTNYGSHCSMVTRKTCWSSICGI